MQNAPNNPSKARLWPYLLLVVVLGVMLIGRMGQAEKQYLATFPDKTAPNFTLSDLNNNPVSLQDYRGKDVVLAFWAYG